MATTNKIARIVALRTGEPFEYVKDVAYNLNLACTWNSVTEAVSYLVLALAAGATPESAASMAKHYAALVDEEGKPAGEQIEGVLDTFLEQARTPYSAWAYNSWFNVYKTVPAICIVTPSIDGPPVERPYLEAHDSDTWRTTTTHEFTSIGGKLLFDIAADLNIAAAVAA